MLNSLVATLALFQAAPRTKIPYVQSITLADGTLKIMTAAQRLVQPGKPDIWLVGAMHVGMKGYYASLQELLDAQEAVFYEGVKQTSHTPTAPNPAQLATPAPPTPVYKILSDALGLEFQLMQIHYDRKGWRNVDLDWDQLDKINKEVGKGKPTQFDQVKQFLDPKSPQAQMMASLLGSATPGMKEALKIMIVKAAGGQTNIGLSPEAEKVVLEARNQAVEDELAKTVAEPAPPKSIAVFYGAMHLGPIEKSLVASGYKPAEKKWFIAATADPKKLDASGKAFLSAFDKQMGGK
ncbi:hypothetical protein BH11ARM2_BH11ARM2_23890 [soil metagenome]